MYRDLAPWWPLLSAPSEYAEEAELYRRLLAEAGDRPPVTLLELGSAGATTLPPQGPLELTLVDLSAGMLRSAGRPTRVRACPGGHADGLAGPGVRRRVRPRRGHRT